MCVRPSLPPHPTQLECQSMCQRGEGRGEATPQRCETVPPLLRKPALAAMSAESLVRNSLPGGRGEGAFQCYFPHGCRGRRRRQNTVVSVSDKKVFCPFPSLFFLRQFFCLCASSTVFFSFAPPAAAAAAFCMFNVAQRKKRKKGSQSITHTRARQAEKAGGGKGEDARSSHPHGGLIF